MRDIILGLMIAGWGCKAAHLDGMEIGSLFGLVQSTLEQVLAQIS